MRIVLVLPLLALALGCAARTSGPPPGARPDPAMAARLEQALWTSPSGTVEAGMSGRVSYRGRTLSFTGAVRIQGGRDTLSAAVLGPMQATLFSFTAGRDGPAKVATATNNPWLLELARATALGLSRLLLPPIPDPGDGMHVQGACATVWTTARGGGARLDFNGQGLLQAVDSSTDGHGWRAAYSGYFTMPDREFPGRAVLEQDNGPGLEVRFFAGNGNERD